jgi:hypothetical protein
MKITLQNRRRHSANIGEYRQGLYSPNIKRSLFFLSKTQINQAAKHVKFAVYLYKPNICQLYVIHLNKTGGKLKSVSSVNQTQFRSLLAFVFKISLTFVSC